MVPNRNGAVPSAVLVHLRVEPAHFDWRWRERPALALLAWEALARDPLARLRRIQVESTGTTINFRPAAITHRDIAASALLIASKLVRLGAASPLIGMTGTLLQFSTTTWNGGVAGKLAFAISGDEFYLAISRGRCIYWNIRWL